MLIRTAHEVGLLIKETRKAAGLTQAQLAERVGASREWVRLVELGNKPRVELGLALRALTALGIALDARSSIGLRAPASAGKPKSARKIPRGKLP